MPYGTGVARGPEANRRVEPASHKALKRLLDLSLALPLFLLSLPVMAVCALWVKAVSPGPALFRQHREGVGGKPITVLKLRTMCADSERVLREHLERHPEDKADWLRFYKLKNDPRVLPGIGCFLRHYSLDELPQLWNVLRGEMSLVGPRPFPYYHLESLPGDFRALRASVPPGVTGLWQVSARSEGDLMVQQLEDTYYIRNWSLWLDVRILIRTVEMVVMPKGAY